MRQTGFLRNSKTTTPIFTISLNEVRLTKPIHFNTSILINYDKLFFIRYYRFTLAAVRIAPLLKSWTIAITSQFSGLNS